MPSRAVWSMMMVISLYNKDPIKYRRNFILFDFNSDWHLKSISSHFNFFISNVLNVSYDVIVIPMNKPIQFTIQTSFGYGLLRISYDAKITKITLKSRLNPFPGSELIEKILKAFIRQVIKIIGPSRFSLLQSEIIFVVIDYKFLPL